jgi:Zn-dependent protease
VWIDSSWLVLLPFIAWSLAVDHFPLDYPVFDSRLDWALGVAGAAASALLVLIHEAAHVMLQQLYGSPPRRLVVLPVGGWRELVSMSLQSCGRSSHRHERPSHKHLYWGSGLLGALNAGPVSRPLEAFLGYIAAASLLLVVLHLIPGWPLDAARVLCAVLVRAGLNCRLAVRVTLALGCIAGTCLVLVGFGQLWMGSIVAGTWLVTVGGLIVLTAAVQLVSSQVPAPDHEVARPE